MDRRRSAHDSALFWTGIAAAVLLVAGILISAGIALKSPKESVWAQPWSAVGIGVGAFGVLLVAWSVRMYLVRDLSTQEPPAASASPPDVSSARGTGPEQVAPPATGQVVDLTRRTDTRLVFEELRPS